MAPRNAERAAAKERAVRSLRSNAKEVREGQVAELAAQRHEQLRTLFYSLRDKNSPCSVGSGLAPPVLNDGDMEVENADQDELAAFIRQHIGKDSLIGALDIALPPLSPSPPSTPQLPSPITIEVEDSSVISAVMQENEVTAQTLADAASEDAPPAITTTDASHETPQPSSPLVPSPGTSPRATNTSQLPTSTSPTSDHNPLASTSAVPYASAATISPSLLTFAPTPSINSPSTPTLPAFSLPVIDPEYAEYLPDLPLDVYRNRMNNSIRKKGKEKATGNTAGPDLFKMNVKAVHTGAKMFIGRGKRVHNFLSTHDWSVGLEEMRGVRAFEKIEQMKQDKTWSFRQPKKQRAGVVPKAHWDHLLDEMRWLHTDFRQERRWKVVTAHNIANAVRQWHLTPASERHTLCVSVGPPNFLPLADAEPIATSTPMAAVASTGRASQSEMDVDADGEEDDAEGEADQPEPSEPKEPAPSETPVPATAHAVSVHFQNVIALRAPIFALGADATIVDSGTLSLSTTAPDNPQSLTFVNLFPDLPLYSDFGNSNDPASEKRLEESSAWSGRINQVSHWLEAKPLLVSTIRPATTKTRTGWDPAASALLDDSRDGLDQRDVTPSSSTLFAGGKRSKESREADAVSQPAPVVADALARATSLHWTPEEDQFIIKLQRQYGNNWSLMADTFNTHTPRPQPDYRLPWDIFDRWDRLAGKQSKKVLADGTELPVDLPEYQPVVPSADKAGPSPQFSNFDGSRKRLRHLTVFDAMRKVQKKRELDAPKRANTGPPRRVNLSMHDSHILPARPMYTPIQWSEVKVEQDMKARALQQQRIAQAQALQQQAQQQQLAAAQAAQAAQQNGARYPQPVPQGFPVNQQGRPVVPLPPSQGRPNGIPGPGPVTSPHPVSSPGPGAMPSPGANGMPQMGAQFSNGVSLTPEQLQMLQHRQQLFQAQQVQAHMRANSASAVVGEENG